MPSMNPLAKNPNADTSNAATAVSSPTSSMNNPAAQPPADPAARGVGHDGQRPVKAESALTGLPGKVPRVTFRTVFMAILVGMGGFIFGYDTGQISGFLEMSVFLERFGEAGPVTSESPSGYHFSNVRSGLIVALVSHSEARLWSS
jgi:hypothetical protein